MLLESAFFCVFTIEFFSLDFSAYISTSGDPSGLIGTAPSDH
jgi:hypothetical protein